MWHCRPDGTYSGGELPVSLPLYLRLPTWVDHNGPWKSSPSISSRKLGNSQLAIFSLSGEHLTTIFVSSVSLGNKCYASSLRLPPLWLATLYMQCCHSRHEPTGWLSWGPQVSRWCYITILLFLKQSSHSVAYTCIWIYHIVHTNAVSYPESVWWNIHELTAMTCS